MNLENFTSGMGSILNLFPKNDRELNFKMLSDEEAIRKDWEAVGEDLHFAVEKCSSEKK